MPSFTPGQLKLLNYWGEINAGVAQHVTTADLWDYVRNAAAAEGFDLKGAGAIDMNVIRSMAARNRNASDTFMAAPLNAELGALYFGAEPYAAGAGPISPDQKYVVRFEHNVLENGVPETVWRADTFRGFLPPTKDALMQQLNADAELIGEDYNQTHVSIGSIAITVA